MKRMTTAKGEKRRHPRIPVGMSLEIHLKGHPVSRAQGRILDLSDGGMAFESDAVMEEGMSFFLRAKLPLLIRGEVRSIRQAPAGRNRYGIRFHKIGLGSGDGARPQSFIAAQLARR